jgi:hypothetical protein
MKIVKVSTPFPEWPLHQQTPGNAGVWGNYRFAINQAVEQCDYWVVYEGLSKKESVQCPARCTILLTAEPPNIKHYSAPFTRQFSNVFSAHPELQSRGARKAQPCLPWHVGRHISGVNKVFDKNYDYLSGCAIPEKRHLISVIASDKSFTAEHRYRLEVVRALDAAFGSQIHLYGRGLRDVEDKWDAIAPYKYHVVLENGAFPDYWTEKLSDSYLAWAYPLYMGCPNIASYFPAHSFTQLEWGDTVAGIKTIEKVLREDPFEDALPSIKGARRQCLEEYNFFPYLANVCDSLPAIGKRVRVELWPEAEKQLRVPRPGFLARLARLTGRSGP